MTIKNDNKYIEEYDNINYIELMRIINSKLGEYI